MHSYMGVEIVACDYQDSLSQGYRWYVQTHHQPSGLPYDEQHCPKFRSLAAAREHIRYHAAQLAAIAESER